MRYGALPIVREAGGLKDTVIAYNEYTGEGTGYSFANINAHELLFAAKNAIGVYANKKEVHEELIKNAMKQKNDWEKSSEKYLELYEKIKA